MLMKPRRWLAYKIELNDLLPDYSKILDRIEHSDIPLDGVFGSNTEWGSRIPGLLLAIGPAVEPSRLLEILALVEGLGQVFLAVHDAAEHSKVIVVGSLNLNNEPIVAISEELIAVISPPGATATMLVDAIAAAPKVQVLSTRERKSDAR